MTDNIVIDKSKILLESKKVRLGKDYSQRKCAIPDCPKLGSWKKRYQNRIYRSKLCTQHERVRWHKKHKTWKPKWRELLKASPCKLCGWDKDKVDTHRIIHGKDGGTYKKENTIGLCPNCHRLVHVGKIIL